MGGRSAAHLTPIAAPYNLIVLKRIQVILKLFSINRLSGTFILAAYAYGYDRQGMKRNDVYKMVVYDFGGGTFDVSILEVKDDFLKHLAIDGDIQLGGRDIDDLLRDYADNEIKRLYQKNLLDLDNVRNAQKLLQMCEQWKKDLTTFESARLF